MRILFVLLLSCLTLTAFPSEKPDSLKNKLDAACGFSLNSNGLASIPAFSLGAPAFIASPSVGKGRFSFDATLGYSLEMKPWYIDSWFHYKLIVKPKFELKAGINFSTFAEKYELSEGDILQAQRYFAFSISGMYKFSSVSYLSLDYWSDNGQDRRTIRGHFVALDYDRSEISLGGRCLLDANLMLFYINYTGRNDGLFISPKLTLSGRDFPAAFFLQANQSLQSNITPWPGFHLNIGISYTL